MSALSAIQVAMVQVQGVEVKAPLTNSTGGTSQGDAEGGRKDGKMGTVAERVVTTRDRVAAGFLTAAVLGGVVGGTVFMVR
jgi:mannan endo-1,6-alpha-mannosidase